jgi:hypothetical protein
MDRTSALNKDINHKRAKVTVTLFLSNTYNSTAQTGLYSSRINIMELQNTAYIPNLVWHGKGFESNSRFVENEQGEITMEN